MDAGYKRENVTILESNNRLGGKSYTRFLPERAKVRHEVWRKNVFLKESALVLGALPKIDQSCTSAYWLWSCMKC
jgi:hypothetical protein